jgi:hypothetical protein
MTEAKSVPTAEIGGTEITRFNALRHGVLSRYTVLPWEDADEYYALVAALVAEHTPQGPTEEHLVEEMAGILWRKRRLRLAEAAAFHRGLEDSFAPYGRTMKAALAYVGAANQSEEVMEAVQATATDSEEEMADIAAAEAMACRALELLCTTPTHAYEAALAALHKDTQCWWVEVLARSSDELNEDEAPATADTE